MSLPPKSARRTADFKAIARHLVQMPTPTLSSDIARELEKAYARGFIEATAGAPAEFDDTHSYPWLQIPARARGIFARWCWMETRGRSRVFAKPFLVFMYEDFNHPGMVPCWEGYELQASPRDYKKSQLGLRGGRTTVQQLIDRKLMARFPDEPEIAFITDYGMATYACAVTEGHQSG